MLAQGLPMVNGSDTGSAGDDAGVSSSDLGASDSDDQQHGFDFSTGINWSRYGDHGGGGSSEESLDFEDLYDF